LTQNHFKYGFARKKLKLNTSREAWITTLRSSKVKFSEPQSAGMKFKISFKAASLASLKEI